jgi:phosphoribosyl 1,2-cyclic phosphodiesterase
MAVFISSFNSGSNGNCYYIGNETEAVLIDAGISCRETERRMLRLGLEIEKVKAIFISHEHSDHINGVKTLSKKYKLPVYITEATHKFSNLKLEEKLVHRFAADEAIAIGELNIIPFKKSHDASDPHSFIVSCRSVNVGIFTDIGNACKQLIHYFRQCHAAFLESNYDEDMLMNGNYPLHLKKRISDGNGHLSNKEALELFLKHRPAFMSHLLLSHLSENNNKPEIVSRLFQPHARGTEIVIASRYKETAVYSISGNGISAATVLRKIPATAKQLALF